jgi:dsDNA-specific endonuclease/ATPase MutS2
MSYRPGDEVIVIALNRKGRIESELGGRYRVTVGALTTTCRENEMRPVAPARRKGRGTKDPVQRVERAATGRDGVRTIDLHGMTVVEAEAAVLAFVNDALLDGGADTLEIVHGIGTGRVRRAAIAQLRRIGAVKSIRPHPANRGVTIVQI